MVGFNNPAGRQASADANALEVQSRFVVTMAEELRREWPDILFRDIEDPRDTLFRYRYLPTSTGPTEVAELVSLQLRGYVPFQRIMNIGSSTVLE